VRPGDTITALLGEYFTPQQIHSLSQNSRKVFSLSRICAGQPYELCTVEGNFESFAYDIDREEQLIVRTGGQGFEISRVPIPYTVQTELVRGVIRTSLFEAVAEIGESAELAIALADIYAWDIDFIRDIRKGDSFGVLVERRFRDGQPAGYGDILAAQFINQGESYWAVRFQDGARRPAYYDLEGNNLRKAFLRAPLAFSRISSGFSRKRLHPITKTWKSHPAIDYAAPVGTPIKTVGDGTVIERGYTKGNGNFIRIRHNSTYQTLYLHMRRFAKGIKRGKNVTQGQVIGYVGSTGLATGPHLCFRMRKNGVPVNPYKVRAVSADPVSPANMADFDRVAALLGSELGLGITEQAQLSGAPKSLQQ
jgi:murein DD-endopeptidase MepM/ murein hydrolase activator NlpD